VQDGQRASGALKAGNLWQAAGVAGDDQICAGGKAFSTLRSPIPAPGRVRSGCRCLAERSRSPSRGFPTLGVAEWFSGLPRLGLDALRVLQVTSIVIGDAQGQRWRGGVARVPLRPRRVLHLAEKALARSA